MTTIRRFLSTVALLSSIAAPLSAQAVVNRATGLSGSFNTIDFDAFSGTLTNLGGATFSSGLFVCSGCDGSSFFTSHVQNFNGPVTPTFSIMFASAVDNFALQIQTNGGRAVTFDYFLAGSPVGSSAAVRTCCGQSGDFLWNGFEGLNFDRVDIGINEDGAAAFDNIQYTNSTVPEPASLVLVGAGLFGVVAVARRRRSIA